eukprot:1643342-Rhodomonas_salina.1
MLYVSALYIREPPRSSPMQALYEMQATESCLPYHWASEQVNTAPECFRMVHSPNYIRLGMLQGALRA